MKLGQLVLDVSPLRTSRDFRMVFTARTVSLFGIGMLLVGVPVQVYDLTGDSLHVAAVSATTGGAVFVGTLVSGVLADRYDRRRLILASRTAAGIGFAVLAANAFLPDPQLWLVYLCGAWDGFIGSVSGAALIAATPTLVPRDKLAAAGALVALTTDLGALISPALGGVLIATCGVEYNYLVATAATAVTVACLSTLRPLPPPASGRREKPLRALGEGLRFTVRHDVVGPLMLLGIIAMLVSGPMVLLPAFVDEHLGGGSMTMGLLYGAPAIGAVLASLSSGWTSHTRAPGRALLLAAALVTAMVALLGASPVTVAAMLCLAAYGFGDTIVDILRFALLQHHTPDSVRGRVSSLWHAQVTTGVAVGGMVAGLGASVWAPRTVLIAYGIAGSVAVALCALFLPAVRNARLATGTPGTSDVDADADGTPHTETGNGGPALSDAENERSASSGADKPASKAPDPV